MTRWHHIVLVSSLLLFIGAGCGEDTPAPADTEPTPEQQAVIDNETIVLGTAEQLAYIHCIQSGNAVLLEFSDEKRDYISYCEFPDGKRCEAIDFHLKKCSQETAQEPTDFVAVNRTTLGLVAGPRTCPPFADPVCGADGRTYTNACNAKQHHVAVSEQGSCIAIPDIELPGEERYRGSLRATPNTGTVTQPAPQTAPTPPATGGTSLPAQTQPDISIPDWLVVPISLLDEGLAPARATIERCLVGGKTYYAQIEDDSFAILYNTDGKLICYPSNDIDSACPSGFSLASRSCTVIWQK